MAAVRPDAAPRAAAVGRHLLTTAPFAATATLRELRRARRRHYLREGDWVDSLYKAYVVGILAAIYAHAGRGDEAGLAIQQLRQLDPELRLSNLGEWLPFQRPQDLAIFADGLRKAGLPE